MTRPVDHVLVTAAAQLPVPTNLLKLHTRVDHDAEDDLVAFYLEAATGQAEAILQRALITQTRRLYMDAFPGAGSGDYTAALYPERLRADGFEVPYPPLQSISSITYVDTDGTTQTLSSANYRVVTGGMFGWVEPTYGLSWPDTRGVKHAVTVTFVAGYGDDPEDVPVEIRHAIMVAAEDMYENRGSVVTGTISSEVGALAFQRLLSSRRAMRAV